MTDREAQRRARAQNRVDAPPVESYYFVSESSRMFGTDTDNPLDDSENTSSLPSTSRAQETVKRKNSRPTMESIKSVGSIDVSRESLTNVASGENTFQGVKKQAPEMSNGNPFTASNQSKSKNRVGPFDRSNQDFMDDSSDDGEIDIAALQVEEIHNWKNVSYQSMASDKSSKSSNGRSRGMLAIVDASKDTYDQSILIPSTMAKKGYYNLSKTEDRNQFMTKMNGMGGNIPGEQEVAYDDDEEQQHESPLFQEDAFKSKRNGQSTRLSNDNPFADGDGDESELNIETFKPRSNKNADDRKYASMQELLEGNASPLGGAEKRKGMGGYMDKVFGGKKTKRRKITLVSLILLVCGGIGATLYVILGMQGGDMKKAELGSFPMAPSVSPSPPSPNRPIGPSFSLPSQVMNATINKTEGLIGSHNPLTPSMMNGSLSMLSNATTLSPHPTSTFSPAPSPISISFNTSMTPTIISGTSFNSSYVPSAQPTLMTDSNMTLNETLTDLNATNTTGVNETGSLVPTPTPFAGNISESLMPTDLNITDLNITDLNITDLNITDLNITDLNITDLNMTDLNVDLNTTDLNTTDLNTTDLNITDLNMTDLNMTDLNMTDLNMTDLNVDLNATDLNATDLNATDLNATNLNATDLNATDLNMTDLNVTDLNTTDLNMTDLNTTDLNTTDLNTTDLNGTVVPTTAPLDANLSLDELSDPWSLSRSIEHDGSSALFGTSLAMSADGSLLLVGAKDAINEAGDATGAVFVYSMTDDTPSLLQVIYGENFYDEFGNAMAISDDGSRLVIGSRSEGEQAGAVRIYSLSTSSYSQLGNTIIGSAEEGRAGWAVAISGDGSVVAVGSPKGGSQGGGSVVTYQYDGNDWVSVGSEIEASSSDASLGYSIALNIDGTVIATGNPKAANRNGSSNAGKVAVYTVVESVWTLTGEVFGESSEDVEGTSVALTPDGKFLITGSKGKGGVDGSMESNGSCQLYQSASNGRWRLKHTLMGQSADERLGTWVAISRDGSVFACGGVGATLDGLGTTGVVRLWSTRTSLESTIWPRAQSAGDSAFGTYLMFSSAGLAVGAPDYSGGDGGTLAGSVEMFSF